MRLRQQHIVIDAAPELCVEVVAAAGRRLEKRSDTEWVVEFVTQVGDRDVRTVELLTLDRPRAIRYLWIEGPLSKVEEIIRFASVDEGRTKLTYRGRFSVGRGPVGWLIGLLRVKPLYDGVVEEHLRQSKELAEKRAARTRAHPRRG